VIIGIVKDYDENTVSTLKCFENGFKNKQYLWILLKPEATVSAKALTNRKKPSYPSGGESGRVKLPTCDLHHQIES
jgi:hypothetical protein